MYRLQTIYKIILWQEEEHKQLKDLHHHEDVDDQHLEEEGHRGHHVDDLRHHEGHKGHQGLEEIVDGHKQLKDLHHHEGHKGHDLGLLADLQLILDKG